MLAWRIFVKSILLIADNLGAALRVTLIPYALLVVFSFTTLGQFDWAALQQSMADDPAAMAALPDGVGQAALSTLVINLFVYIWIAVGWHRYVLLGEGGSGWLPLMRGGQMLGYLGRLILLVLIILGAALLVTIVLGLITPLLAVAAASVLGLILFFRLGLILPAGAIGQPITLVEAWKASDGHSATVVILALLSYALQFVFLLPASLGGASGGVIAMAYGLVVNWIMLITGISLLSTLYGHLVEGRAVD